MGCKCCSEGCSHHHDHEHEHDETNYLLLVIKIIVGILALFLGHVFEDTKYVPLIVTVFGYIFISYDIFYEAFKEVKEGEVFSEYLLMIIATVGAFFIGEYHESIMVMLLFIVGELLQAKAVEKSRKSIVKLVGYGETLADVKKENKIVKVDVKDLKVNDIILLKRGEMLSVDGELLSDNAVVDDSNLTGESLPKNLVKGNSIFSGSLNSGEVVEVKVVKEYKNSKINKVLSLVEEANDRKSKSDKIIRKVARIYTPIVILCAIMIVVISAIFNIENIKDSIYTALTFLLISCPCAIIISVPITYFAAIGGASKRGVLIKGANFLDKLCEVKNIAFDKTGTLSEGKFAVTQAKNVGVDQKEFIKLVVLAQKNSTHPLSVNICEYYESEEIDFSLIDKCIEIPGKGIETTLVDGTKLIAGNSKLMMENNVIYDDTEGTSVHFAKNGKYIGYVVLEDKIKESSYRAMKKLDKYKKIMLSGDNDSICQCVSEKLGLDGYYANLLPEEKMAKLEELIKTGGTMFVGDGVNDTLSISLADVSVSMGIRGSDASIEYSDIVIENDNLENIHVALKFAKKVRRIIIENLISIMSLKVTFMILSMFGLVNMWLAIFSDVGLCILSIINSMRAFKVK